MDRYYPNSWEQHKYAPIVPIYLEGGVRGEVDNLWTLVLVSLRSHYYILSEMNSQFYAEP